MVLRDPVGYIPAHHAHLIPCLIERDIGAEPTALPFVSVSLGMYLGLPLRLRLIDSAIKDKLRFTLHVVLVHNALLIVAHGRRRSHGLIALKLGVIPCLNTTILSSHGGSHRELYQELMLWGLHGKSVPSAWPTWRSYLWQGFDGCSMT